ncbi:Bacterial type II secretion system protein F domain protein [Stieleria bergensis]|uniref:Bacterial type II secretion system protein F domain protein n=1 Tax=Stieleria bergensis TaxID=2528025 RepID=A0A517SSX4_9BACT|nr:Bacterial type II secretion system protein F domain protein [Planctomycetes bacterium SV_7m_r]
MYPALFALSMIVLSLTGVTLWHYVSMRWSVSERLHDHEAEAEAVREALERQSRLDAKPMFGIQAWLFRAGYRGRWASVIFWSATAGMFLLGSSVWYQLYRTGTIALAADTVGGIPGGVGNVMVPFVLGAPWFFVVVLTLAPTLVVRSVRRRRVQQIEQDLPLLLDLLNTLSQAGVGFDSALEQVLIAGSKDRPLTIEMRTFQADNLAGRSRIESLRRLMRRVEVTMFSTFISAIVQAEQVGAGVGETLKIQAGEMRSRRREKASAAAMAVPTLLVAPMVIGFLPGIFVVLIGPMVYEAFGAMGQTFRGATGQ